jgi:hypothetical protein
MSRPCHRFRFLVAGALLALAAAFATPAAAQVPTCEALTLYGNAFNEHLCRSLSPTTQNLWVCDLSGGAPDVHTTFNAGNPLHLTVRNNPSPPGCQGNSTLGGNWPGALVIAPGQPAMVCGVSVQNYVNRLNAVVQVPAGAHTLCTAPFIDAIARGADPALMQTYINTCGNIGCP